MAKESGPPGHLHKKASGPPGHPWKKGVRIDDPALLEIREYVQRQADGTLTSVSDDYSATAKDSSLKVDTSRKSVTVTLPSVSQVKAGKRLWIGKPSGTNTLTVAGFSGELINGAATIPMTTAYSVKTLVNFGTEWVAY